MTSTPAEILGTGLAAVRRHDRPDLEARLRQAEARLVDGRTRVLVVGEFKQGKSMLVNCLASAPVCAVSDDIATAVPLVVRHAEKITVTLVRRPAAPAGDATVVLDPPTEPGLERVEIEPKALAAHVTGAGVPDGRLDHVEVGIPRPILAGGLELVDTPGVGGLSSVHGAATTAALPTADAVLLVSDASQEYTAPELEFLARAVAVCPNVACVLTKNDLYPQWRRIAELDREHLERAGIVAPLFAVSSTLRWEAVLHNDSELNEESGFPALVGYLRRDVVGQADRLTRRSVAHDVTAVVGQLAAGLRAELAVQTDPNAATELVERLSAARERAGELKDRSARWMQTLNDGVTDLNADIDHDLRGRMREITRTAEEEINAGDPTKTWEQFTGWMHQEVASAVAANFVWATQRVRWLGEKVSAHFCDDRDQALPALRSDRSDALSSVRPVTVRSAEPWSLGQKMFTGVRGGYMGMIMVTLTAAFIPALSAVVLPLGLGAGVFLGGKSIRDERKRIVAKRRLDARNAVKRYIDDVTFHVSKDSRDRLRGVQRDLRDHFSAQAEQLNRSLAESLQAAERAVKASENERKKRIPELRAELEQLESVRKQARGLVADPQPAGVPA
jgi:hypothetical protein